MAQCKEDTVLGLIQTCETAESLHLFFAADCMQKNENEETYHFYADILDNDRVAFSCEFKKTISIQFDNFGSHYQCDMDKRTVLLVPFMQYSLNSGYKLITANPDTSLLEADIDTPILIGKSNSFILDSQGNRLFNLLSPLSNDNNHCYFPGAILPNDDVISIGFSLVQGIPLLTALTGRSILNLDYRNFVTSSYAIYWETSSLAYFKPIEATPASTLLSGSALLVMTQSDLPNIGLCILLAVNVMLFGVIAKKATKHASQYATRFFSERRSSNVPLRQDKDNDVECQLIPFDTDKKQDGYDTFSETTFSTSSQNKVSSQVYQPGALMALSIHNKNKFSHPPATQENDRAQNKKMCAVM
jgi:hypothetical protein